MPDTSSVVITGILNTKISEVKIIILDNSKYITTQEFDKLTAEILFARLS